ncbi:MAG TPA: AI-2E family transporter [Clostridiaceae bacterium]|nr:AI-2E family transporter [Clostridiaceae bacterium]
MRKKTFFKLVLILFLLIIIFVLIYYKAKISRIITPFILAVVLTYILNPLVCKLHRKNIPISASILLVYTFFILFIASIIIFLIPELINNTKELIESVPDITARYQKMFAGFLENIQKSKWSPDIKAAVLGEIEGAATAIQKYALEILGKTLNVIMQTVSFLADFILALVIAFYLMKDKEQFIEAALSIMPLKWRNGIISTGREVSTILSNFVQGQLLTALIIGILESIGLYIVGVKYALILGVIGGISNIIPYFGPFIAAIPSAAIALLDSPIKVVWTILVFIVVQQIDNAFISTKIIEGRLGLHPVVTIFAVLIGGEFFGIIGMMLAVPVFAVMRIIFRRAIDAIV